MHYWALVAGGLLIPNEYCICRGICPTQETMIGSSYAVIVRLAYCLVKT